MPENCLESSFLKATADRLSMPDSISGVSKCTSSSPPATCSTTCCSLLWTMSGSSPCATGAAEAAPGTPPESGLANIASGISCCTCFWTPLMSSMTPRTRPSTLPSSARRARSSALFASSKALDLLPMVFATSADRQTALAWSPTAPHSRNMSSAFRQQTKPSVPRFRMASPCATWVKAVASEYGSSFFFAMFTAALALLTAS
mmetsp:Transcript_56689/g.133080  ORF Transcript_56689/g.133080 Transcript_56689/m.133080 type:complete len:203 (+) Transcript_56689:160-768(+)